jgi:hypothetical protein
VTNRIDRKKMKMSLTTLPVDNILPFCETRCQQQFVGHLLWVGQVRVCTYLCSR